MSSFCLDLLFPHGRFVTECVFSSVVAALYSKSSPFGGRWISVFISPQLLARVCLPVCVCVCVWADPRANIFFFTFLSSLIVHCVWPHSARPSTQFQWLPFFPCYSSLKSIQYSTPKAPTDVKSTNNKSKPNNNNNNKESQLQLSNHTVQSASY